MVCNQPPLESKTQVSDEDKFGYWGGISPDGKIAETYKTRQVHKQDGVAGGTFTVVDADDAAQMYDDFYK